MASGAPVIDHWLERERGHVSPLLITKITSVSMYELLLHGILR